MRLTLRQVSSPTLTLQSEDGERFFIEISCRSVRGQLHIKLLHFNVKLKIRPAGGVDAKVKAEINQPEATDRKGTNRKASQEADRQEGD